MKHKLRLFSLLVIAALPQIPLFAKPNATLKIIWVRHRTGGKPRLFESKNGRLLVVETDEDSTMGSTLQLWNMRAGRRESTIKRKAGHALPDTFEMMALSDDGMRLLTRRLVSTSAGIYKSQLEFWNLGPTPRLRSTLLEPDANMAIDAIPTANPVGWKLLSDNSLETLDANGSTVALVDLPGVAASPWGALSPDGKRVVLSEGPTVFDAAGHKILTFPMQGGLHVGFEFSPDAGLLVVAHRRILHSPTRVLDSFELWDLTAPTPTQLNISVAGAKPLWSPDGSAVLGDDGRFRVAKTGSPSAFQIAWPASPSLRFDTAQMSRDEKNLAIADSAGNIWLGSRP